MAAAVAVLPPCTAAVAMKTPEATAMVGAQTTINNQLKALTATTTEMASTMTMEAKPPTRRRHRQRQCGEAKRIKQLTKTP